MPTENKTCPSYDCRMCNTHPAPYGVKCEDVNKDCKWRDFDFTKTSYEEYLKENKINE